MDDLSERDLSGKSDEDLMFGLIAFERPYFKVDEESKPRRR